MRKIAIINHKGGVGKTTTTNNLGAGLALSKKKVLLIDLDSQAHLTYALGIKARETEKTISELFKGKVMAQDAIINKNGLDIIPGSVRLSGTEIDLLEEPGRERILSERLENIPGYDFVLVDCPPRLGVLTLNALVFCREVIIPLQAETFSLNGLREIRDTIELVKKRLNPSIKITGVLATRFDKRKGLNREIMARAKKHFPGKVFKTVIRENISLAEAPGSGRDIFSYKRKSKGAEDYGNLAREVIRRK